MQPALDPGHNDDENESMPSNHSYVLSASSTGYPNNNNNIGGIPRSQLPLHLKCTADQRISYDRLRALPVCPRFPAVAERNDYALGWASDVDRYAPVSALGRTAKDVRYTKLSSKDVAQMLHHGVIRRIAPEEVRGCCNVFDVLELARADPRRRIVRHTVDINEALGPDTVMRVDMATKADIIDFVLEGNYLVQFDAAGFFDQLPITDEVGVYSCFKKGRNFFALTTAPTGQRHIVELAHTTLQRILHFPGRRCSTAAIIDNAFFAGETAEDCEADGKAFVERCASVNCKLNGDTSDIAKLVSTEGDIAGVHVDMRRKRVSLPQKMLNKIRTSWSLRARWSRRSFVSHMGLLFWTVGLCVANPGDYFTAVQFYASLCREIAFLIADGLSADAYLDQHIDVPPEPLLDTGRWTSQALLNVPRQLRKRNVQSTLPNWLVCVDSCSRGFGYVALNPTTGEARSHGQVWPAEFAAANAALLHRSVFTEPNGAVMAMCHLLTPSNEKQHVHIWTDSVTTMASGNRGYNLRSADVNNCTSRLRAYFPEHLFEFSFAHIAGADNVAADALSRGHSVTINVLEGAAHRMREMLGGGGSRVAGI